MRKLMLTTSAMIAAFGLYFAFPAGAVTLGAAPAPLPVAQMVDEHDHGGGLESHADPASNLTAPALMIAAGLLYLGFVRWQIRWRERKAAR